MTGFILRRLAQLIPVLLIASFAIWAMIFAVPGGPIGMMVGENATAEEIAAATRKLGLDRPIPVQYFNWLVNALRGDFGQSIHSHDPVTKLIGERLPATLQLALVAILVALVIGIPVAIAGAVKEGSWIDRLLNSWNALALGVPTFWLGILLILLFSVELRWLPSASRYIPLWEDPVQALRSLILPGLTLGLYVSGILARFLKASLVSEARADYVRTARAKGVSERHIVGYHIMQNALLPFITIVGLMVANFIGGAVVTEAVFTYPGLGRLLIQAISTRDYPLIQGCIVVILVIYMAISLIVDILYAVIDPRIEYR
ncbi:MULTISPECIES: ABC transporter permease [unclassified Chelatococcus]|uniref:ABC transporter permease n=1 Tax=unclassified Chelatococcus TaxID=2638111 RepID=UPI001BD040C3|nr:MULTISPECIES: ABC transporter permease [unclassified Chelatococcus]CAH1647971.1 putative peptide transport system permease protein BAB2_1050 [Hyphomicrobiales bacterium]MBS7742116.1 ABC transporter permease [Chelatococcus sp. HY11]MBX3542766.1 ABC transporter permease [Chelatococcus sp.]MCO5075019.1 ABC transporter permease [Chelatococcus sp.]CAH1690111.1 putative peptide transport system permease protein BAB2_1050 [Hyphomicrobiales bacterium]